MLFKIDLSSQYFLPNLFAGTTMERASSEHHFVGHHTHSEIVHRVGMVLSAEHLGSHVAGRAACVAAVVGPQGASYP